MALDRTRLIEPDQLADVLAAHDDVLIVDVCSPERFASGHIAGAQHVSPAELVAGAPPAPGRIPSEARLSELFSRLGLTEQTLVVACDDEGGGWAGRLIWTLDVLGHDRWKVIDGGTLAWSASGLPLTLEVTARTQTSFQARIDASRVPEAEEVLQLSSDGSTQIWDARSPEEYRGEKLAAAHGGHIPGARNLDWLELMDRHAALRLRGDVESLIAERGIDLSRPIITHCQSHHRSGLTWLVGRLLGADIRGYHGSWSEWGNRDDLPVRAGPDP